MPDEVDGLKKRVADLEEKIGGDWPPDICRYCGKRAARLWYPMKANQTGIATEDWKCSACNKIDKRSVRVK
jgi:hypothetical protein